MCKGVGLVCRGGAQRVRGGAWCVGAGLSV